MEIKILHKLNRLITDNTINVVLEYNNKNNEVDKLIEYINSYNNTVLVKDIVKDNNELIKIYYSDIRYCYCKEKNIYCKTKDKEYKIKSRLYELEKLNKNFIRVSKKYVVNFNYVQSFNVGKIGTILIKLDNNDTVTVSRRRIRDVLEYLDERGI